MDILIIFVCAHYSKIQLKCSPKQLFLANQTTNYEDFFLYPKLFMVLVSSEIASSLLYSDFSFLFNSRFVM